MAAHKSSTLCPTSRSLQGQDSPTIATCRRPSHSGFLPPRNHGSKVRRRTAPARCCGDDGPRGHKLANQGFDKCQGHELRTRRPLCSGLDWVSASFANSTSFVSFKSFASPAGPTGSLNVDEGVRASCPAEAEDAASLAELRHQGHESMVPLLHDPCARHLSGSQLSNQAQPTKTKGGMADAASLQYLVATRFLDDVIMAEVHDNFKDVRQVVLVSAGSKLDATRPYRLPIPRSTIIFDVSPAIPYEWASSQLKKAQVRMPAGTLLRHVSADVSKGDDWRDEGWGEKLCRLGYRGDRPSIWVLQDCGAMTTAGLRGVLGHVRCLAKSRSSFVGEIGLGAALAALGENQALAFDGGQGQQSPGSPPISNADLEKRLTSLFAANGFTVEFFSFADVSRSLGLDSGWLEQAQQSIALSWLFQAQQQRMSDIEIEVAEQEIRRAEAEGDEEGWEDSP